MKDSGVPWLEQVPVDWEIRRARYLVREVDIRSTRGSEVHLSMSQRLGLVPSTEIEERRLVSASYVGAKLCAPDDLVLNRLKAHLGVFARALQCGLVSPDYTVLRGIANAVSMAFVEYVLRSSACRIELRTRAKGLVEGFWRLYTDDFYQISLPVPPIAEQRAIVQFLDEVDRRIRRYVRAKQKLIRLLEEQKQAIIHRAMTRGLDPKVRLKPSGVDSLGNVPKHWSVKRLKWVTRLQRGYDLPADHRIPGPIPVVSSGGIIGTHQEARCKGPGVVIGRYGSTDAVFFVEQDFWPHNTALFVTDFHGNRPRWCYYMLRAISKADHSSKSAVPGVDRKDLFEINVSAAPVSEQDSIIEGIETASGGLDSSIAVAQREIALLREYRARLIDDVVTGKLDVREAAAKLSDEADEPKAPDQAEALGDSDQAESDDADAIAGETDD